MKEVVLREGMRVHCVGVGGMGLGPLAIYLKGRGCVVSGEDDAMSEEMRGILLRAGVELPVSVDFGKCDVLVRSPAVKEGHAAVVSARAAGVPVLRRGEMLAVASRGRKLVAVCGSHGKTTTTAMLVWALKKAGVKFDFVLGGLFNGEEMPARAAEGAEWLVAEVDESDGTIGKFDPELTVLTNLDWDHPDFYRTREELEAAFGGLFERTKKAVVVNEGDEWGVRVARGRSQVTEVRCQRSDDRGRKPEELVEVPAGVRGEFNLRNAGVALEAVRVICGKEAGMELLGDFAGVRRRQGVLVESPELAVVEDYAHHPAEVKALLSGMRERFAGRRIWAVFQSHRFSRTKQFLGEFAEALVLADAVCVLETYGAGEGVIEGGTGGDLYGKLREVEGVNGKRILFSAGEDAAVLRQVERELLAGDVVVFAGAGSVGTMGREWVKNLGKERKFWNDCAGKLGGVVKREVALARMTTMGVGGAARLFAETGSVEELGRLLKGARELGVKVRVLGRGSDLVVRDEGVDGLVVKVDLKEVEVLKDGRLRAGAGARLKEVCGAAAKAGIAGLEFLEGIPASVGGALRMNAGAMGGEIFNVVESVEVLMPDGSVVELPREKMVTGYRKCAVLEEGGVALRAVFRGADLEGGAKGEILGRMEELRKKRVASQPREPSAGCFFKNPEKDSAGRLVDACGLKGMRVGGAVVSPVHGNFIVNEGGATAGDVLELGRRVRVLVKERAGVELVREVEVW